MANPPPPRPFLWGHFQGGVLPLAPGRALVIGRKPGADLVIADDLVSRSHARLTFEGDDLVVEDLGSTNGTYLNGVRMRRERAVEGDRILVGGSIIKVVARDPVSHAADEARADPGVATAAEQRVRAMQGHLEEVPLLDLLQLIASARKTGLLSIERPGHEAEAESRRGRLVRGGIEGGVGWWSLWPRCSRRAWGSSTSCGASGPSFPRVSWLAPASPRTPTTRIGRSWHSLRVTARSRR